MSTRTKVNIVLIGYGIGLVLTRVLDLADELATTQLALEGQRRRADSNAEVRSRLFESLRAERHRSAELDATVRELRREAADR